MNSLLTSLGRALARYLSAPRHVHTATAPTSIEHLLGCLQPCDIVLVEGHSRVSLAIKYLTNSTWSHASLFVGDLGRGRLSAPDHRFIEAALAEGVRSTDASVFDGCGTRICRPIGLTDEEREIICDYAISRIGHRYDLRNVIDLARYLIPHPPVPEQYRRRMIALGSGDPTRAICSTLIAQAFDRVRYPILPTAETRAAARADCPFCTREVLHIRHHTLYAPRDFDVSPYFDIIKPTIKGGFDFRNLVWAEEDEDKV